jgi:glycine betaine/proline transport system substrate-binding protein
MPNETDRENHMFRTFARSTILAGAFSVAVAGAAFGAPVPASCKTVRFSDVGWTDITATTATATVVLQALGYSPNTQILSVPVTYASMKNKDIDIFLGNWMPTMEGDIKPYREDKSVDTVGVN